MRLLRLLRHRFRSLLFPSRVEAELRQEIELHLQQLVRELVSGGMPEAAARLEARRQFGAPEFTKELCRDMRRVHFFDDLLRDVLYALRLFRKSPGFTFTALASLALGIGANTAIFQLFDAVRLRSLPVERPGELATLRIVGEGRSGNFRGRNAQVTNAIWEEFQRRQHSFAGVFAFGDTPMNLSPSGELRNADGIWVSGSYFPVLGVKPALGRLLSPDDDRTGCAPAAVISHAFWQREFGGDPNVLSKTLPIDGRATPILGVTPPEFFGIEVGRRFDIALPICAADRANLNNRVFWFLTVAGRLLPTTSERTVRNELAALSPAVFESTVPSYSPGEQALYAKLRLDLEPGDKGVSGFREEFGRPLTILLCMVVSVLLVACANLANMLLARATAREHEFAVRVSLGASHTRIVRQLLIESLLLASAGAAAGALLAPLLSRFVVNLLSTARDPLYLQLDSSWRVLLFTMAAAIAATVLFGVAPALHAARTEMRGGTASREKFALRRGLLITQVALCTVLLTGALLFSRSFRNLTTVNPGFQSDGVLVANTFFASSRYPVSRRAVAYDDLQQRLSAIPGVTGVARGYVIPISGSGWDRSARRKPADAPHEVNLNSISDGYFRVLRIPLLAGREFSPQDRTGSPPVGIVNQAFAKLFFPGENPVGQTFKVDGPEPPFQIIGLAGDTKYSSVREELTPIVYFATRQEVVPRLTVRYLIRTAGRPEAQVNAVKQAIAAADPQLSVRFVFLKRQIEESLLRERLLAALATGFGILAAMLALMGAYGVTAYIVERRRREFGIRIALGATKPGILRMVMGQVARDLGAGIVVGSVLAIAAGTVAAAMLYGIHPNDPSTLLLAVVLIGSAGLAAGLVPAFRAASTAVIEALRE